MNRLKELRTQSNLSLRKLQEYIGVDFSRLAIIEKTDANIEMKTLHKIIEFFGVSSEYFYGGDGFISYYNEQSKEFFRLPYEQYKNSLTEENVSMQIDNNRVVRIISSKGYELINNYDNVQKQAIDFRIQINRIIKYLDSLPADDHRVAEELIKDSFNIYEFERRKEK